MLNERIGIPATTTAAVNKLIEAHERGELVGSAVIAVQRTPEGTASHPNVWVSDPSSLALILSELVLGLVGASVSQVIARERAEEQRAVAARLQAEAQAKAAEEAAAKPNRKTRRAAARKRR